MVLFEIVIVNDRLVFLRLQKCASTTISGLLLKTVGGERLEPSHRRIDFDPGSRFVFASVRDPWSWYLSMWSFGCQGKGLARRHTGSRPRLRSIGTTLIREVKSDRRSLKAALAEFSAHRSRPVEMYERLYRDVNDVGAFREWLRIVHDDAGASDLNPNYFLGSLPAIAGFYTFNYLWLFVRDIVPIQTVGAIKNSDALATFDAEQNICDAFVRTDRLSNDLPAALTCAGYDMNGELGDRVRAGSAIRANQSAHSALIDYFDDSAVELVAGRDALIIAKHQFKFGE